jgi:hypothetical protein
MSAGSPLQLQNVEALLRDAREAPSSEEKIEKLTSAIENVLAYLQNLESNARREAQFPSAVKYE